MRRVGSSLLSSACWAHVGSHLSRWGGARGAECDRARGPYFPLVRPKKTFVTPRALALEELPGIIEPIAGPPRTPRLRVSMASRSTARTATFSTSSFRTARTRDGRLWRPVENRARLMLEAVDAAVSVWGPSRVGLHLAPRADAHSMGDSDREATFTYVAREVGKRGIALHLHARGMRGRMRSRPKIKAAFGGSSLRTRSIRMRRRSGLLKRGAADAVAFGKLFIANPIWPKRLRLGAPLNAPVPRPSMRQGLRLHGLSGAWRKRPNKVLANKKRRPLARPPSIARQCASQSTSSIR